MTTTVEVYANDVFRSIEVNLNTNFCDVCNRQFFRSAYYRCLQSNIQLASQYQRPFQIISRPISERAVVRNDKFEDM